MLDHTEKDLGHQRLQSQYALVRTGLSDGCSPEPPRTQPPIDDATEADCDATASDSSCHDVTEAAACDDVSESAACDDVIDGDGGGLGPLPREQLPDGAHESDFNDCAGERGLGADGWASAAGGSRVSVASCCCTTAPSDGLCARASSSASFFNLYS